MKPSEILMRRAATIYRTEELIVNGEMGSPGYPTRPYTQLVDGPFDLESGANEHRVLALCLASAIAKSEGN